jgi:peptide subunit release factor 1 (eRF1)
MVVLVTKIEQCSKRRKPGYGTLHLYINPDRRILYQLDMDIQFFQVVFKYRV